MNYNVNYEDGEGGGVKIGDEENEVECWEREK